MTQLTRWFPISLVSFFFHPSQRSCSVPIRFIGDNAHSSGKEKETFNVGRKGFLFLFLHHPCAIGFFGAKKNEPVIFNGETNKNRRRLFYDFFFFSMGDLQCVKVSLRCFVYYLFVCGPRWEERINRRGLNEPLMNGRCGLPSFGSRGDDVVFKSIRIELIKLFSFQNRKEEKS